MLAEGEKRGGPRRRWRGSREILARRLEKPEEAALLAGRTVKVMAEPLDIEHHHRVRVGIAVAPVDGEDGDSLMKNADLALY